MTLFVCSRVRLIFLFLTAICVALLVVWLQHHSAPLTSPRAASPAPLLSYGQVPLSFEANHGQANELVQYLAGSTMSATFPTTPGAYKTTGGSPPSDFKVDLYLTKLKPDGRGLVYSTFLGGQQETEEGLAMTIDQEGNAYLAGRSNSTDFPQVGMPTQTDFFGAGFVMKELSSLGNICPMLLGTLC